jgi:hypothetical protein
LESQLKSEEVVSHVCAIADSSPSTLSPSLVRLWIRIAAVCLELVRRDPDYTAARAGKKKEEKAKNDTAAGDNDLPLTPPSARVASAAARQLPLPNPDHLQPAVLRDEAWAMYGVQELGTSAPDEQWLLQTLMAAEALWQLLPPEAQAATEAVLGLLVAASPARAGGDGHGGSAANGEAAGGDEGSASSWPPEPVSGVEALVVVAGQMNRNGYSWREPAQPNNVRRLGLYPATAMVNHSCAPNCAVVSCPGGVLEVRTLQPLVQGQELLVSYVNLVSPRDSRRAALKASKEFDCACLRCAHPDAFPDERSLSHPLCPHCGRTALRPPPPWPPSVPASGPSPDLRCWTEDGGCGAAVPVATAAAIERPLLVALAALERSLPHRISQPESYAEALERLLTTVEEGLRQRCVAPQHWAVIAADCALAQALMVADAGPDGPAARLLAMAKGPLAMEISSCAELAARHMRRAVSALQAVLPPQHWPELCGWQLRLGSLLAQLAAKAGRRALHSEAVGVLRAGAKSMRAVCATDEAHGRPPHPLLATLNARLAEAEAGNAVN